MRFRPLIFAVAFVAAFYFATNSRHAPELVRSASWVTRPATVQLSQAAAPDRLDAEEQNNVDVYQRVAPAVVNVTSQVMQFNFFYGLTPAEGQGSGFLIDKQGHILTNYHVIENAQQVDVTLYKSKRKFTAQVLVRDPAHDLALIQIPARDLPTVTMADSSHVVVGQKVYAIGNPFGLSGTMSRGIISSFRPIETPAGAIIDEAIQTDAAINPGNSGGPLLNMHGEVIGINTMIATGGANQSAGIGFAIPINTAKAMLDDFNKFGRVRRPSHGIRSVLPIGPELAQQMGLPADNGLLIMQLVPGGAAERAGLYGGSQRAYLGNSPILTGGDLIVAIDEEDVSEQQDIARIMNQHHAGDTATFTIYRGKQKLNIKVTLGEAPNSGRA